ncbi:MAG: ribonuclease III [Candidatus Enteromonas sp.]|nr:ribonuclease III [Candidatus Enteromonas sp.]
MASPFRKLFHQYGILPHDEELYLLAFTHPSCNSEAGTKHVDYERLEFLGDSIVGMAVGELCYRLHPEMHEGELTQIKNQMVMSSHEAQLCLRAGLTDYIRLGGSFVLEKDPSQPDGLSKVERALYENVFEAFVGALFLDQGYEFTHEFLRRLYEKDIQEAKVELDPKSALQQHLQADGAVTIIYRLIKKEGSAQDTNFCSAVYFDGIELGRGEGKNKKAAEMAAAKDALQKLCVQGEE